jgi:hypothetical protein
MFIVVIFFLIYGVEVYFKVRICLCILINVMFGIFVICREAQLSAEAPVSAFWKV